MIFEPGKTSDSCSPKQAGGNLFSRLVESHSRSLLKSSAFSCVDRISSCAKSGCYSSSRMALERMDSFLKAFDASPTPVFDDGLMLAAASPFPSRLTPSESGLLRQLLTGTAAREVVPVARVSDETVKGIGERSDRREALVEFLLRRKQLNPEMRDLARAAALRIPDPVLLGYANRLLEECGYILDDRDWNCLAVHGKIDSGSPWGMRTFLVSGLKGCSGYYAASGTTCIQVDRWLHESRGRLAVLATINPVAIHEAAHWFDDHLSITFSWERREVEYNAMLLALLFSDRFFTKSDLANMREPYASAGKQIVANLSTFTRTPPVEIIEKGETDLSWIQDRIENLLHHRYKQFAPVSRDSYNVLLKSRFGINETISFCRDRFHERARVEGIFLDLPCGWFTPDYRPPRPPGASGVRLADNNWQQSQAAAALRQRNRLR